MLHYFCCTAFDVVLFFFLFFFLFVPDSNFIINIPI